MKNMITKYGNSKENFKLPDELNLKDFANKEDFAYLVSIFSNTPFRDTETKLNGIESIDKILALIVQDLEMIYTDTHIGASDLDPDSEEYKQAIKSAFTKKITDIFTALVNAKCVEAFEAFAKINTYVANNDTVSIKMDADKIQEMIESYKVFQQVFQNIFGSYSTLQKHFSLYSISVETLEFALTINRASSKTDEKMKQLKDENDRFLAQQNANLKNAKTKFQENQKTIKETFDKAKKMVVDQANGRQVIPNNDNESLHRFLNMLSSYSLIPGAAIGVGVLLCTASEFVGLAAFIFSAIIIEGAIQLYKSFTHDVASPSQSVTVG